MRHGRFPMRGAIWQRKCCPGDERALVLPRNIAFSQSRARPRDWCPSCDTLAGTPLVQPVARRLGDLLVTEGLITQAQLATALTEQRYPEEIGTTLMRLRFIFEEQLLGFLSQQFGIPSIALARLEIDLAVLALVPAAIAREYDVL